ncbi:MAG: sigma-70 family RNA polymerase sigma factor [Bacteroidales bacterium]
MQNQSDEKKIVEEFLNGSVVAFEKLYVLYYSKMCSYAYSYLQSRDEAEDVVQNVFVKIWESRGSLSITHFQNYVIRAVKNACINQINITMSHTEHHDKIKLQIAQTELQKTFVDSEDTISSQTIQKCIDELPQKTKEVIRLKYVQELSALEISNIMHTSKRTVETQIYNGIKLLFSIMKAKHIFFFIIVSSLIRKLI